MCCICTKRRQAFVQNLSFSFTRQNNSKNGASENPECGPLVAYDLYINLHPLKPYIPPVETEEHIWFTPRELICFLGRLKPQHVAVQLIKTVQLKAAMHFCSPKPQFPDENIQTRGNHGGIRPAPCSCVFNQGSLFQMF